MVNENTLMKNTSIVHLTSTKLDVLRFRSSAPLTDTLSVPIYVVLLRVSHVYPFIELFLFLTAVDKYVVHVATPHELGLIMV